MFCFYFFFDFHSSDLIKLNLILFSRSNEFTKSFILILFPTSTKRPEFYLCKSVHSNLEFALYNGFNKLIVNVSSSFIYFLLFFNAHFFC